MCQKRKKEENVDFKTYLTLNTFLLWDHFEMLTDTFCFAKNGAEIYPKIDFVTE